MTDPRNINMYGNPRVAFDIPKEYENVANDLDELLLTLSPEKKTELYQKIQEAKLLGEKYVIDIAAFLIGHPLTTRNYIEKPKHSFKRIYNTYEQVGSKLSDEDILSFFTKLRSIIRPFILELKRSKRVNAMRGTFGGKRTIRKRSSHRRSTRRGKKA